MDAFVYKPSLAPLLEIVDFFIFFKNENQTGKYKSFPNSNLCLTIYKSNKVKWDRLSNHCSIGPESSSISSKLFGFHKQPFLVSYSGEIDQICILLKPGALLHLGKIPPSELIESENPLVNIFGKKSIPLFESIFEVESITTRQILIEEFLQAYLKEPDSKNRGYLNILNSLSNYSSENNKVVEKLSHDFGINPSTLYRNSLKYFGQSVQEMYRTLRFRKALADIVANNHLLTQSALRNGFFDQSHLLKDFRKFTGETPRVFQRKVSVLKNTLLLIKDF